MGFEPLCHICIIRCIGMEKWSNIFHSTKCVYTPPEIILDCRHSWYSVHEQKSLRILLINQSQRINV